MDRDKNTQGNLDMHRWPRGLSGQGRKQKFLNEFSGSRFLSFSPFSSPTHLSLFLPPSLPSFLFFFLFSSVHIPLPFSSFHFVLLYRISFFIPVCPRSHYIAQDDLVPQSDFISWRFSYVLSARTTQTTTPSSLYFKCLSNGLAVSDFVDRNSLERHWNTEKAASEICMVFRARLMKHTLIPTNMLSSGSVQVACRTVLKSSAKWLCG